MAEKPTSFDIAFLAGVSQPTVSRALRGSPVVSLETRKRIEEIARQLNYRVDKNASNLRSQHSNTLALLLFEDPTPDDSQINPFFLSMLGSITRASARQGYDLLISFQQLPGIFTRTTRTAARPTASSCWVTATTRSTGRGSTSWSNRGRISCVGDRC
jgi:transcriptional regulator with XRE-family HTH domain